MSGLHDGISTVFVLRYQNGFCFDGYKSERELVEHLLYRACSPLNAFEAEAQIKWIDEVANKVKEQLTNDYLKEPEPFDLATLNVDPSEVIASGISDPTLFLFNNEEEFVRRLIDGCSPESGCGIQKGSL